MSITSPIRSKLAVDQPDVASGEIYNCGDARQLTLRQWVDVIAKAMGHEWTAVSVPDAVSHASRDFVPFKGSAKHRLMDLGKVVHGLGYRDVVDPLDAIERTVRWFFDNPPRGRNGDDGPRADRGYPYTRPKMRSLRS